jgi:hypothetical protein
MVQLPIVVGLGGGVDFIEAALELLRDPIALRYLRQGAVMMAQTGHVLSLVLSCCSTVSEMLPQAGPRHLPWQARGLRGTDDGEHAGKLPWPEAPSGELSAEKRFPYSLSTDEHQHERRGVGRQVGVNVACAP